MVMTRDAVEAVDARDWFVTIAGKECAGNQVLTRIEILYSRRSNGATVRQLVAHGCAYQ